jgi:predicted RNase H-like HicB family nuclease
LKSYIFRVVVKPDGDAWHARVPELESKGAASWGKTQEEALRNIQEVARVVIEELLDDGEPIPRGIEVHDEPLLSVTL